MENLRTVLRQLRPGGQGPSQIQAVTTTECEVCNGAGWLLIPGRDHENFPAYRGCHNCENGRPRFLVGMGFAENERLLGFEAFDARRQIKNVETTGKAWEAARAWAKGKRVNLALSGPIGVGKTHLAKAAIYAAGLADIKSYFITGSDFDSRSKNFDLPSTVRERFTAHLIEVPRLAFDDIGFGASRQKDGVQGESQYMKGQLESLFDGRYRRELGTLLTTNLTKDEFASYAGVRVLDRFMQDGEWLYMPGVSQR